jgi:signal transduction histidine kinase
MVGPQRSRTRNALPGAPGRRAPLHVLLVEDDDAFSRYVRAALDAGSDTVHLEAAGSLATAVELLRGTRLDGILLDLNLPDSQGLSTLRRVIDAAPRPAVVILTGVAETSIAQDALRLGAQDWLIKGQLDPEVLQRALRYAVERKRLTDGLLQAQKLEIAGRLATGVAHEFNNVLTAILGSAQLAEEATDEESRRASLDLLRRAARQGAAVSRQLLSLSRNPPTNPLVVSAASLVQHATPLVQAILPSTIQLEVGPVADVDVRLDSGQFDQMLLNLVFNARDAMPTGGTLGVRVDAERPGPLPPAGLADGLFAVVRVTDTGRGIDEATLPRLFEPFFTTKGWGGTGLGLAVSAEIVERFGGAIQVESQVGTGTTFAIWLPASELPANEQEDFS